MANKAQIRARLFVGRGILSVIAVTFVTAAIASLVVGHYGTGALAFMVAVMAAAAVTVINDALRL